METLCKTIIEWCKKYEPISNREYPIVMYGLQMFIANVVKMLGILIIGAFLKRELEVFVALGVFCSMRYRTGGYHSKSHLGCFLIMLFCCTFPTAFVYISSGLGNAIFIFMGICAIMLILRYAPVNSKINPIKSESILKANRRWAIIESILILLISFCVRNGEKCWFLIFPLFMDGVLLMMSNDNAGGEKNVY